MEKRVLDNGGRLGRRRGVEAVRVAEDVTKHGGL